MVLRLWNGTPLNLSNLVEVLTLNDRFKDDRDQLYIIEYLHAKMIYRRMVQSAKKTANENVIIGELQIVNARSRLISTVMVALLK